MSYLNVFNKLDQDITGQIQNLQVKQQELMERKKNLSMTKQKIQTFLSTAGEIKQMLESQPELVKSLQNELVKIFTPTSNNPETALPIKKEVKKTVNVEKVKSEPEKIDLDTPEESVVMFNFVDAQGKTTSF